MNRPSVCEIRQSMERAIALQRYHRHRFEVFGNLAIFGERVWWVALVGVVVASRYTTFDAMVWLGWLVPLCVIRIGAGVGFRRGFIEGYEAGRQAATEDGQTRTDNRALTESA